MTLPCAATCSLPCRKYLDDNARDDWTNKYIDYKSLKDLIKAAANEIEEGSSVAFSPRMTSLSVQRKPDLTSADERFNMLLEKEVCCSSTFLHFLQQAAYMLCSSGWCQPACQAAMPGLGMHTCEAAGQRLSFMRTYGLGVCASTLRRATGRGLGSKLAWLPCSAGEETRWAHLWLL